MKPLWQSIIIGAGFAGLGMAVTLKQRGEDDFLLLEKSDDVGGVWHDNTYPGAACDVPSHLYSFSFARHFRWSRRFAEQPEILAYLQSCARHYQLYDKICFNSTVRAAHWQEQQRCWQLQLSDGSTLRCRALITATGQLNQPLLPNLPGIDSFTGEQFHSARWRHDIDLTGKRVAVIGTGASAIQFVPRVAHQAQRLTLFQRSAAYVIDKPDRRYRPFEHRLLQQFPILMSLDRLRIYLANEMRVLGFTSFKRAMAFYRSLFRRQLRRQVADKALRDTLTPDYPMGCKRILMSNDYYPALCQSNVRVISGGVQAINNNGVIDSQGREHNVDVIIFGTGFQATEFLAPMTITGRHGQTVNNAWRDGAEAYLGITVHGFPNLFMLYGPNTNLGHNSIIYMLESQFRYITQCLTTLHQQQPVLEVRAEVQQAFNKKIQHELQNSVWSQGCDSWYKTASGKITNNWPGFTFRYRRATRQLNQTDYLP